MPTEIDQIVAGPAAMPRYQPLVLVLVAAAAGIVVDRYFPLAAELWWLASLTCLAAWIWLRRFERAGSCFVLASAVAIGGSWHHDQRHLYPSDEVGRMVREEIRPIAVEGVAMTSPRWVPAPPLTALRAIPKPDETEVTLWVTAVRDGRNWRPASGWALLDIDGHLIGVRAGDRLRIMALGSRPLAPLNPGEFDYAAYERSRRVWCRLRGLFPESIERVERGSDWSPRLWLGQVRDHGAATLRRMISPERSTLAAAVLIGAREQLDPDRNEGFLVTGTIHVLSISGLHVGILAAGFWMVFRTGLFPRRTTLIAAMLLTVAYACLTDLQPPVVRATILILVMCLAQLVGRRALGFNTLAAAGLVVLALNPASLFLAGPQLSFLAVAAMIVFHPVINPPPITDPLDRLVATTRPWPIRLSRAGWREIRRVEITGTVVWLVSLPLVWKSYNLVSPVALILNLLMWIPISIALYAGFGALLMGVIVPPLGQILGWICDFCLWLLESSIEWGRQFENAFYWLPAPPWWWIGLFYAVLASMTVFPALRPRLRWIAAGVAVWFATGALLAHYDWNRLIQPPERRPLACHFVAVGHGICALVELPDGRTLLYDTGKLGSPLGAVRPASALLWSRGLTHIDALVVSHADTDHFNGIPDLIERFSIGAIYVSPVMFERPQPAVGELTAAIERAGIPVRTVFAGDRLDAGGARIEVLHPPRKGVIGSDNANSIVLLIEFQGQRILLTGDLEPPGLVDVMAEEPLDCDVVLAPHHGSRRSDPSGFALWSTPDHVVISGGRNIEDIPDIESVKDSYRARGAEVYHTAEDGCITFRIDTEGVRASTFRPHVMAHRPSNP